MNTLFLLSWRRVHPRRKDYDRCRRKSARKTTQINKYSRHIQHIITYIYIYSCYFTHVFDQNKTVRFVYLVIIIVKSKRKHIGVSDVGIFGDHMAVKDKQHFKTTSTEQTVPSQIKYKPGTSKTFYSSTNAINLWSSLVGFDLNCQKIS